MTVKPPKKQDAVYAALRAEILNGSWPVGQNVPREVELAQRFGCSPGTVNKAIALLVHEGLVVRNRRSGTRVINNALDSQPARNSLDAFAFIYPSENHEGIRRTINGFQDAAREAGRRTVMLTTGLDYQKEAEFIGRMSEFDVRGAVVYPIIPTPEDQVHFSKLLLESKFPIVLTELSFPGLGCSCVMLDGFHAGYTMTKHMLARGAKAIGFFSNFAWAPFMRDRYMGYRWALQEAGVSEPPSGVYLDPAMHANLNDPLAEPVIMAKAYLSKCSSLDAVVCAGDFLAAGCIIAARMIGLSVPDDLLVSGIDNQVGISEACGVPLTTYHVPYEELGALSFQLITDVLSGALPFAEERRLAGRIIVRESA